MDQVGEHASARAFFQWVAQTIRRHARKVDRVLDKLERGRPQTMAIISTPATPWKEKKPQVSGGTFSSMDMAPGCGPWLSM